MPRFDTRLASLARGFPPCDVIRLVGLSPTGRVVHERPKVPLAAGANRVGLDASGGLAPGVYWVRVTRDDAVATRKAIILPR